MYNRIINNNILEIYDGEKFLISFQESKENEFVCISIKGELSNNVAHEFEDEIMAVFSVCQKIRIDLAGVSYIASLAMQFLLSLQRMIDENESAILMISSLNDTVRESFDEMGFLDILNIEE